MPVLATKTELRCKLCAHPRRPEIDALLERRSKRERDEDGNNINVDYVRGRLREMGVPNPTAENIKVHWKKHCEVITSRELDVRQEAAIETVEKAKRGELEVSADEFLDFVIAQGFAEAEARILLDGRAGVTIDQALKAVEAKTRRRQEEAQADLLRSLGGGIQRVFGVVEDAARKGLDAPKAEIVEGEAIEEAELLESSAEEAIAGESAPAGERPGGQLPSSAEDSEDS